MRRHPPLIAAIAYASYGYYSVPTVYRVFAFELSMFLYGSIIFHLRDYLTPSDPCVSTVIAFATAALVAIISSRYRYYVANQYELYAVIGVLLPALFDFA